MLLRKNTHGILIINDDNHCRFMVSRNTTKSLSNIWQKFSFLLDEGIAKICKKFNSLVGFLRAAQGWAKKCCWISWIGCVIYLAGSSKSYRVNWIYWIMWAIPSSSEYQKRCQMLERLVTVKESTKMFDLNWIKYLSVSSMQMERTPWLWS